MPDGARAAVGLAELVAEVRALAAEVRELRAAVAPDLGARAAVLVALRGAFGTAAFTSMDALEAAAAAPGGPLERALVPVMGDAIGGARRLARRMAKMAGRPAGGLVLARIGDDRGSALYVIQAAHWPV